MFCQTKYGQVDDEKEKYGLSKVEQRELAIDQREQLLWIGWRCVVAHRFDEIHPAPAELRSINHAVQQHQDEKHDLGDQPAFLIPRRRRVGVPVINVADACGEQDEGSQRREQADRPYDTANVDFQVDVLLGSEFSIENKAGQECRHEDADAKQMENEIKGEAHMWRRRIGQTVLFDWA